ncbi:DUF7261 family protein [Halobacterium yunchengense]|uniref:DUF7261 family protein n=1 Tax=Halobacterium yunchengense TaxID=3108497 RepID=UPI00300935D3
MTGADGDRGQLVLVAAAVAALALVPVAAAYLQFGYAPAVAGVDDDPGADVARALDRVADAGADAATGRPWSERDAAVAGLRESLAPRLASLERERLADGVAVNVTYDPGLAADVSCPGGDGRAFGDCENHGGVVVQERAGETVVVAVAFRVQVAAPDGATEFGRVVRPH